MKPRSLPPAVPVTSLRVYEPAHVFPPARRERWQDEVTRPDATERAADAERREAWRRLVRRPPLPGAAHGNGQFGIGGQGSGGPGGESGNGGTGTAGSGAGGSGNGGSGGPGSTGSGQGGSGTGGIGNGGSGNGGSGGGRSGNGRAGGPAAPGGVGSGPGTQEEDGDPLADYARVLRIDGTLLVCPASLGDGEGPRRTLVRAWDLPLPWMLVIALGEDPHGVDSRTGRYLVTMARARAQAARALRTLRSRLRGTEVTAEVEVLARWLEGFHPRSWVELDARPVVALLGGDDGLEDVRFGLECLTTGDSAGAAAAYQRLRQRSHALTDISRLS